MTRLLKAAALGATLAIAIATASALKAEQNQASPSAAAPGSEMHQRGMSMPGGMMGPGGENASGDHCDTMKMMGMMQQMSQMMDRCDQMMQGHMQAPNSRWRKPGQPD